MASRRHLERTATSLASLSRSELTRRIRSFRGGFRLDFTDEYLDKLSVEKLRHILLAALISGRR